MSKKANASMKFLVNLALLVFSWFAIIGGIIFMGVAVLLLLFDHNASVATIFIPPAIAVLWAGTWLLAYRKRRINDASKR